MSLEINIGANVQPAVDGLKQVSTGLKSMGDEVKKTDLTWTQFVGQRMGAYMQQFGSHGAAIKQIALEWQNYKNSIATVPPELAKIPPAAKTVEQVLKELGKEGVLSIGVIETSMKDLRTIIKQTTDPTDLNKLKDAYRQLQLQAANLKNEGGLASQLGGISRATRTAHSDLEQISQSIRGFANGSERGADALSNLVFTFERLSGQTGGIGAAFSQLGKTLLGPAGIVLAVTTLLPLMENLIGKLFGASEASKEHKKAVEDAKKAIDDLAVSTVKEIEKLTLIVGVIENHNTTRENQKAALKKVNEEYGPLLKSMGIEQVTVDNLNTAYTTLIDNLLRQAVIKGLQDQITESVKKTAAEIIKLRVHQEELAEKEKNRQQAAKNAQEQETERVKHLGEATVQQSRAVSDQTNTQLRVNKTAQEAAASVFDFAGKEKQLTNELIDQISPLKNVATSLADIGEAGKNAKPDVSIKGLDEAQRKLVDAVKKLQATAIFEIPLSLKVLDTDLAKEQLKKAQDFVQALFSNKDQRIKINVIPDIDFKGKKIEPPSIEDLPIDLGTIGVNLKGKEKFDDRLQEAFAKGIIIPITPQVQVENVLVTDQQKINEELTKAFNDLGPVFIPFTPQVKVEDLKGLPSAAQLKIIGDLTKHFNELGTIGTKAFNKISFHDAQKGIEDAQRELIRLKGELELTKEAADAIGNAFGDAFGALTRNESPIKAFFNSIIRSIEQMIAKLIAAKVAAAFLNILSGGATKGIGAVFSAFAEGGSPAVGVPAIVGERGPELFVPNVAGKIIPNHQLKSFAQQNFVRNQSVSSAVNNSSFSEASKTLNNFSNAINNISKTINAQRASYANATNLSNSVSNFSKSFASSNVSSAIKNISNVTNKGNETASTVNNFSNAVKHISSFVNQKSVSSPLTNNFANSVRTFSQVFNDRKSFNDNVRNVSSVISNHSFSEASKTLNDFSKSIENSKIIANKSIKSFSFNDIAPAGNAAKPSVIDLTKQLKSNYFINNLIDVSKFSASLPHLQTGGITTSDTIAQLHKAEVIMPLDRLSGLIGKGAGNDLNLHLTGKLEAEGSNLALVLDRHQKFNNRNR